MGINTSSNDFEKYPSSYKSEEVFLLYSKIRTLFSETSILESLGAVNEKTSRYTIIGVIAKEKLTVMKKNSLLENLENNETKEVEFSDILDSWIKIESNEESTPFQTGVIGYIGYDMKHCFEKLDSINKKDSKAKDLYMIRYSLMHVTDRVTNTSYWVSDNTISKLEVDKISKKLLEIESGQIDFKILGDVKSDFTKKDYLDSIKKTIEYIRQGDIFQANITMRFSGKCVGDPFVLYEHLRETTPNPFFAYFDFETPVLSTSPERFFKINDNRVYAYPIKGTIKCEIDGKDQKETLLNSEKDRAENVMITDLLRNDIGKFCKQGSVNVSELCGIRKFNNIYHLESIVEGDIKENIKFSEVLKALFPGGSITGAPKIRAMDIIEELEFNKREIYTGAIGFFGRSGFIDTNIAIRTLYFENGAYYFHAGGGITTYSESESEYEELKLKVNKIEESLTEFNILKNVRAGIDSIDNQIMELLSKRFKIVEEVGEIKTKHNIAVVQKNRIDEILSKREIIAKKHGNIPSGLAHKLFETIINFAIEEENKMMDDDKE